MRKGSIKNNRINGEVQRELSCIIRDGVKDPRVDPLLSVTRVEVTPDLQFCKCYISTLSGGDSLTKTIEGLKNAEGYIRRELAHRVNLRKTPVLQFVEDHSIEYGVEMSMRIEQLARQEAGSRETDGQEADGQESETGGQEEEA